MRIAASVIFLVVLSGTAHAGGVIVIPPLRLDMGPAASLHERHTGGQIVVGVHLASLWPSKTSKLDVGLGMVSGSFALGEDEPETAPEGAIARVGGPVDEPLRFNAGYLEVATRPSGNGWWRTWLGVRIESGKASKDGDDSMLVGAAVRLSAEAYMPAVGGGGDALIAGILAVGVYSEVSWRRSDVFGDDIGASLGLSMRIPFIFAAD